MDTKEVTASPLSDLPSGSSPIKTPSSYDSDIQNAIETNGLNSDAKTNDKTAGAGGSTSSSSSRSSSSSEDEGFVSGGEEFEPASEQQVLAEETLDKGDEEEYEIESFVDSSEFPTSKVELPIVNVSADDDDVEKIARALEGEEVERDGVLLGKEPGVVEGLVSGSNIGGEFTDSTAVDVGGEVFEEKPQITEDYMSGENSNSNELVKENVLVGSEGDKFPESSEFREDLSSTTEGSSIPEEKEVDEVTLKDKEAGGDKKIECLHGENSVTVSEAIANDEVIIDHAELSETKLVEADGVKLTTEGNSVVEAIQVDMPVPGVAVVGNMEENESVALVSGSDQASHVEPSDSKLVDANGVNLTTDRETIGEAIDVDRPVPGVAIVGKMKEDGDADLRATLINGSDQSNLILVEVVDKEVVGATNRNMETNNLDPIDLEITASECGKVQPIEVEMCLSAEKSDTLDLGKHEMNPETVIEKEPDYEEKENGSVVKTLADGVEVTSNGDTVGSEGDKVQAVDFVPKAIPIDPSNDEEHMKSDHVSASAKDDGLENGLTDKFILDESVEVEAKDGTDEEGDVEGSVSYGETDGMIFGSSEAAKLFMEELEQGSGGGSRSGGESSHDHSQMIDGQIVTDSDEEGEEGKELFDSSALAALLKAATGGGSESGNITITSQDGSRLFSVERPAGLGSSLQSLRPTPRPARSSIFTSSNLVSGGESDNNLSEEEKKKLEKLQSIRVKFFRLVQRLGLSPDESVAAQVLYRLALVAGRQTGQLFGLDAAKRKALELEAEGQEDLDFSLNIMVLGKSGVGKSATINSIFGEDKAIINAFQPATTSVKEISGMVDGVKVRVFDTPGLKSSVMDQAFNRSVLSSAKKFTKKNPPDIVLYVDRLDAQTRDLNDLPLLRTVTSSLGQSIWRSAIVTLTHAASAPPDGPAGTPLSYEVFVTQRSHVVQQCIGQAVGDLRMMSPSLMNPVSLVENHPSCRKNREGQKVLPNGQSWRPQLLLLCYSMKILSEANSLSKPQDPFDHRKLFGFRARSPPLPYMLSSMLQSRAHPKLSSEQGGDNGDSDIDLADLSDSDHEEDEDEYDQLPPFKPLKKSQLSKLSKEQRNAYFEEYDYRVKLLQKKQWKEELKRMKEIKKKGKDAVNDYGYMDEEADSGTPAPVAVPLPDMALPPSFDSDNPAYRFRFLEPTSQFLARPVLDTHGWDHDCGYDGVNIEQSFAIASSFPAVVSVQITKDKKDFSINLDSSVSTKHGENGSTMAGFDIQPIGKQLAYIIRGETKFKNFKKNKTAAGMSITFLGENVVTGFKVEDQIGFGKQYSLVGSAGTVRFQNDTAYGANLEVQRRELDYPIGQVQSTFGLSIIKWRGDLALGFNSLAQFSVGRGSKVAVRAGINNKLSGQITVRTSSSEHLSLALAGVIPAVIAIYKKLCPDVGEKYSIY